MSKSQEMQNEHETKTIAYGKVCGMSNPYLSAGVMCGAIGIGALLPTSCLNLGNLLYENPEATKKLITKKIILHQLEGRKRWIRLISLKETKNTNSNIINSFKELVNQFKSRKKLMPTFTLQSDKNVVIKRLDDFFKYDENSFIVSYELDFFYHELKNSKECMNEKLKLLIVHKDLNLKYINIEIDSLSETIENIKIKIEKQEGIKKTRQRLIYNGEELENEKSSLSDNFIQNNYVLTLKIISEEELIWQEQMSFNFCLEKTISNIGGCIQSSSIDLEIPVGAVDNETEFCIEKSTKDFDYPIDIHKLSPILELKPHSIKFNELTTITFKNCNFELDCVYFFKQEDNKIDRILKKWKIYYPAKCENNEIQFKLDCFSFGFLGKLEKEFRTSIEEEIGYSDFREKFQLNQVIHPGLNYQISCENNACTGNTDLMVFKKNYGTFRPNEDVLTMSCHICTSTIISIKSVILFQSEGIIEFCLNNTKKPDYSKFKAIGNQVIIFGDEDDFEEYDTVVIKVLKSSIPHKNTIAGITKDDLKNSKISKNVRDTVTYIAPNPDFAYKEFDPSNADFKLINTEVRISLIVQKITPVYEYIQPHVTNNTNICMLFKLNINKGPKNFDELLNSTKQKDIFLFLQENDEPDAADDDEEIILDPILNKWDVFFSENQLSQDSITFKLEKFYRVFLGKINYEVRNNENKITLPFGLSYFVSCETDSLIGIVIRGYGNFNPMIDIRYNTLRCPSCNESIINIECIKAIILHQAYGNIAFTINGELEEKRIKFETSPNKLILFGDRLERFNRLIIETNPF